MNDVELRALLMLIGCKDIPLTHGGYDWRMKGPKITVYGYVLKNTYSLYENSLFRGEYGIETIVAAIEELL
jgi:hypothetical protein